MPSLHPTPSTAPWYRPVSPSGWALVGLALLGVGLRLWRAHVAGWYWDEGYFADIAQDLSRFQRPRSGALWFNGVLPLTTSWLAPLSAAPLVWLSPLDALAAARLWAALLGGASILFVGLAGKRLAGWGLGLGAAALLAAGPFPVALGGLALYHHLGAVLALAALWTALPPAEGERAAPDWLPWLLAGCAAAACYWMWWAPLALCFGPSTSGRRAWLARLALGFGPLALALGLTVAVGDGDAVAMWKGMLAYNFMAHYLADLSKFQSFYPIPWKAALGPFCSEMGAFLWSFPAVWLGLGGLLLLNRRRWWVWLGPGVGLADLLRQRGNPEGSAYALVPLLPWVCLGLAVAVERLTRSRPRLALLGLAAAMLLLLPRHLDWIERLSVPPPMARNLQAFLRTQSCGQDTVVAEPNLGWRLRQVCRPVELCQSAAARGWSGGLLPAGLSPRAFAYDPSLAKARFLVTSPEDYAASLYAPHVAMEALMAEAEAWPKVFDNPSFRVYANPRFGPKPMRHPILGDPGIYALAAKDAQASGHADWAAYAQARATLR